MKFLYRYQDHGGHLSEGEVAAPSQAEAYSFLRKSGVRPMKVWPAPGLVNRLASLGKRGWSIVLLGVLCLAFGAVALRFVTDSASQTADRPDAPQRASLLPLPRQQCAATGVKFKYASEQTLSLFASPGDLTGVLAFRDEQRAAELVESMRDFEESLADAIHPDSADAEDARTLKRIVVGLKSEARTLLVAGAKPRGVLEYFVERQQMEADYRSAILQRVENGHLSRDRANANLRTMGLAEIAPDER